MFYPHQPKPLPVPSKPSKPNKPKKEKIKRWHIKGGGEGKNPK